MKILATTLLLVLTLLVFSGCTSKVLDVPTVPLLKPIVTDITPEVDTYVIEYEVVK